jgi:hypothetical protein
MALFRGIFQTATTALAGGVGFVPAPTAGKSSRALFANSSFAELPLFPLIKNTAAGAFISSYNAYDTGAGATETIRVRTFALLYVPANGEVDTLGFATSTAPSPGFNAHVAIWNCSETGYPDTLVVDGIVPSGVTGFAAPTVSVTPTAVTRGFYYISFTADATTSTNAVRNRAQQSNAFMCSFLGSSLPGQSGYTIAYTATTYNQTTHNAFTTLNARTVPYTAFQYV